VKLKRAFVLTFIFGLLSGCSQPDFYDVNGNGISLQDLHSKPLIVNYWATWCGPCIKEIPELNDLAKQHASDLNLVGVNFDQPDESEQKAQADKMKIEFPVLAGEPSVALGVTIPQVLPTTYVFATGGKLIATLVGPQTQESLLKALEAKD
tara:strand:+ start:29803 stop:30255 length:453 start_codon:yes stop_codon:yes gene_type:complete